jgi:hypothetical protein
VKSKTMVPTDFTPLIYSASDRIIAWVTRDRFTSTLLVGGMGLLSKNLIVNVAEIAAIYRPELKPVTAASFGLVEWIGLVLIAISIVTKLYAGRHSNHKERVEATVKLYNGYAEMPLAEKQIRFSALYSIMPATDIIDALMSHPRNPVGVTEMYIEGGVHVIWDKTWFRLRSKSHQWKMRFTTTLFFTTGAVAVLSLAAGLGMIVMQMEVGGRGTTGLILVVEGILTALGAAAYLKDIAKYAKAKHLINANPRRRE